MKIWYGYGSEHSSNLVMIGCFRDTSDAAKAKEIIDRLKEQVFADVKADLINIGECAQRYTDGIKELLDKIKVYSIGPTEFEQFYSDFDVNTEGNKVVIKTEEIDVSAFLKVLIAKGARVEVYSAHVYSDTGYGRGE